MLCPQSFLLKMPEMTITDNIMFNLGVESIDFGCTQETIDEVNEEDLARLKHVDYPGLS